MKTIQKLKPHQIVEEKLSVLIGGNSNNGGNNSGGNGSSGSNSNIGSIGWDDDNQ